MIQLLNQTTKSRTCEYSNKIKGGSSLCGKPVLFYIATTKGIVWMCDSCMHVLFEEIRSTLERSDRKMTCNHTMLDISNRLSKCFRCSLVEEKSSESINAALSA